MAKRKKETEHIITEETAPIVEQIITDTVEKNYMPYVMSVIISRAIPEIDGFKPSHRKVLYTMLKMGLLTGQRTKSANVVGQTMKLHPHGDASIYETLVRMTRGNETLLHPFVDSKGSFGKQYSSDMAYAASRYTEVKLDPFCEEIFGGIDKNAVDFVPNYDNTLQEPVILPTTFPNILVSSNMGIAVGLASRICSFNLAEVCDGAIQVLRNPDTDVDQMLDIIKAPDFSGGGYVIYDRQSLANIYRTGKGNVKLRAKYVYDKKAGCIDIKEIPYSTSLELIMKKLTELFKDGKLKEVTDFRDEIDLNGFKLTIDVKKGTDPDKLMAKLFKLTPLEDDFSCNFNVLIDQSPKQLGIVEILKEWIKFRLTCLKRELTFDLDRKKEKLHLLHALAKVILNIDKAIRIIRSTQNDKDVIPNLMEGFKIDKVQAEYIAEIKLRNLNKEYLLKKTDEISSLEEEIADLEDLLKSEARMKTYIARQLREIKAKYGKPRKTQLIYAEDIDEYDETETTENYNVKLVYTKEGYFKKITLLSLRASDEQKLKEGDEIISFEDSDNLKELLFFTDMGQCYKSRVSQFDTTKASALGDYVPGKLGFAENEHSVGMCSLTAYAPDKYIIFIFANGKGVKVAENLYETKGNRKKLSGACSTSSPVVAVFREGDKPIDIMLVSSDKKAIVISSALIPVNKTRTSNGVTLFSLKKGQTVVEALVNYSEKYQSDKSCKKNKIPATGVAIK